MFSKIEASSLINQRERVNRVAALVQRVYKTTSFWEHFFGTLILLYLVYFSLRILVYLPYIGFSIGPKDEISEIFVPQSGYPKLEIGDQVTQINQENGNKYYPYFTTQNYEDVQVGDSIRLEVIRDHTPLTINWTIPGFSMEEFLNRFLYILIPFTFWMFGMLTALMIRPKNRRRNYLTAFLYITAIWLMAGTASAYLLEYASKLFTTTLWISIPIYLILHWDLTRSVDTLDKRLFYGLYSMTLVLCVLDLMSLLPQISAVAGLMIAVVGCVILLITHLIFHKNDHDNLIKLLTILLIIFTLPTMLTGFLYLFNSPPGNSGSAIFMLLFIPMTYFLITSHNQLKTLQRRSNRTLTQIFYGFIIFSISTSIALFTQAFFQYTNISLIVMVILLVVVSSLSILIYPWFQRFIDQRFFGIKYPPETMIEHFTTRITTSLDDERLTDVLQKSVFPSLMIREAVIFKTPGKGISQNPEHAKPILCYGLPASLIPSSEEIISISERVRSGVTRRGSPYDNLTTPTWVKLALPLWVDSQFIGICLFGRHDPDDHYSDQEIKTLKTIMNQTALALVNIDQARQLHALYQNDMERQEKERSRLARELHDNVLNKMALFAHTTNDEENEGSFSEILGSSVAEIREIIHNLRPSMLNFGLMPAINELVDELVTAKGFCRSKTSIDLDIKCSQSRFSQDVELHIFRIIQEACYNALTHSCCESLCITGQIDHNLVDLTIADDGNGFESGGQVDLQSLLTQKRYGLAGMFERAYLISADIAIKSSPGSGTEIRVFWQQAEPGLL